MSATDKSQQELVEGVRAGKRTALKAIYCKYYPDLCGFAASYVTSKRRGREVVQEVFLEIWERRESWKVSGSLKSYLFQAVRNRALNFLRTEKNRYGLKQKLKHTVPTRRLRTAEDNLCYDELSDAIEEAVEQLSPRRREAFTLHRQHGLTYKEIAEVMEISPKTVENHIGRALKSLREMLSPEFI